jgi:hypothetical protein
VGLLVQCVPDSEEDHVQAAFGYPSVLAKAKRRRPETCVGCGELMSCTQKELLVVKGRAVSALCALNVPAIASTCLSRVSRTSGLVGV